MKKIFQLKSIKIIISLLIIGIFFSVPVFAEGDSVLKNAGISLSYVVDFLSWGWFIFALLAGKLMTNEFVYGSFMHLDAFLRSTWNIMKNVANYILGFMFLFEIIKSLFTNNEGPGSFIKNKIVGFLLAGILIQASWFLIGASLDIVTITTSAVGAFPGQFIEQDAKTDLTLKDQFTKLRKQTIVFDKDKDFTDMYHIELNSDDNTKDEEAKWTKYLDDITPSYDDLSGPLIFLGSSILKFNDYGAPKKSIGHWTELFSSASIHIIIVAMFTIAMILIFIINVMRIVIIRLFVCLSPILILFAVLQKSGGEGKGLDLPERLKFSSIMSMIVKPVIYTAYLSLILIFMTSISRIIGHGTAVGGVTVSQDQTIDPTGETIQNKSKIDAGDLGSFKLSGIQNSLSDLIIFFFAIFLCWQLVKISAKGNSLTENLISSLTKFVESGIKTLPIIPLGGGAVSVKALASSLGSKSQDMQNNLGIDIKGGKFDIKGQQVFEGKLNQASGIKGARLSEYGTQFDNKFKTWKRNTSFNNNITAWNGFFDYTNKIKGNMKNGLSINGNPERAGYLKKLLEEYKNKTLQIPNGNSPKPITIKSFEENQTLVQYLNKNTEIKQAIVASMTGTTFSDARTKANTINIGKYVFK